MHRPHAPLSSAQPCCAVLRYLVDTATTALSFEPTRSTLHAPLWRGSEPYRGPRYTVMRPNFRQRLAARDGPAGHAPMSLNAHQLEPELATCASSAPVQRIVMPVFDTWRASCIVTDFPV